MIDKWLSVFALLVLFCPPIAPIGCFAPLPLIIAPEGAIQPTLRTTGLWFLSSSLISFLKHWFCQQWKVLGKKFLLMLVQLFFLSLLRCKTTLDVKQLSSVAPGSKVQYNFFYSRRTWLADNDSLPYSTDNGNIDCYRDVTFRWASSSKRKARSS